MFERFNEGAIETIRLAQEEAAALGHNRVGTEAILLGLMAQEEGIAAQALTEEGVTLDDLRSAVEKEIGRGNEKASDEMPFDSRAKRVLELSWDSARRFRNDHIGTEHLILGLLRVGDGVACKTLRNLKVDLARLQQWVQDEINPPDGVV
jgi:ATP-dependent Clp protease ATP-binding subunit ClpC